MPRIQIIIEDHVVPQLLTSAIEAYEIQHKAHNKGKANHRLETYGLLWGYALPARGDVPVRLVAVLATVETSALRKQDSVQPDSDSLLMKRRPNRKTAGRPPVGCSCSIAAGPHSTHRATGRLRRSCPFPDGSQILLCSA